MPRKKKPQGPPEPKYKLRFVKDNPFRIVPANTIRPHDLNWRTHGEDQLAVLRGAMGQVGVVGAGLVYEENGELVMIDGHARREELGADPMGVLVLDVDRAEANFILSTFDPIGAMAGMDRSALDALLREVQSADVAVSAMLADLAQQAGVIPPDESVPAAVQPGPQTWQILVTFEDEAKQTEGLEALTMQGYNCRSLIN